jgi:apolipoprotein D and lipocalin family protein
MLAKISITLMIAGTMTVMTGCQAGYALLFPPLDTVDQVELDRYLGKWYEIAKYPVRFQQNCVDATAEYSLNDDGTIRVLNTCQPTDGSEPDTIEGYAVVTDTSTNSKLLVYFPGSPFGAPYWIIDLAEDYSYAVVGEPSRNFLWILSRTPTMQQSTYDAILEQLPEKGYDPEKLEIARSTDPIVE